MSRVTHFYKHGTAGKCPRRLPSPSSRRVIANQGIAGRFQRTGDRFWRLFEIAVEKILDGPVLSRTPDNRLWVVPLPANKASKWFRRHMTGRGQYKCYVEFYADPSELRSVGGFKCLFLLGRYQNYIEGRVNPERRSPNYGSLGKNLGELVFVPLILSLSFGFLALMVWLTRR